MTLRAYQLDEDVFEGGCALRGLLTEFGNGTLGENLAVVDDGDLITETLDHFEDVRGQKDGSAMVNLFKENVFHETRANGVHAFERFVHQEETRPVDQCGGHGNALPHSL